MPRFYFFILCLSALSLQACLSLPEKTPTHRPQWLAGDHHVHSQYSVGWNRDGINDAAQPPNPVIAGDAAYEITKNAEKAREYGLSWMVSTDHGGPNHSRINLEQAYPDVIAARAHIADMLIFYGMELDIPGADHATLIMPHTSDEAENLYKIERDFNRKDAFPPDPARDQEHKMREALAYMEQLKTQPVIIANHPARSVEAEYFEPSTPTQPFNGQTSPKELREWQAQAPNIIIGMEGAPGHQAHTLKADGTVNRETRRGYYYKAPTMGGFDPMTAILGGVWDSLLGEGRRWWITASSDAHKNWREGGPDFWPGEYSKTYVLAEKSYDSVLKNLRAGKIFVATGGLISELYVTATTPDGSLSASIGEDLTLQKGEDLDIEIRFLDPKGPNNNGDHPSPARVDIIIGDITGPADINAEHNPSSQVVHRAYKFDKDGPYSVLSYRLVNAQNSFYVRIRGTNTDEDEPAKDLAGENPWQDLWFYSNPIFITVK